MTLDHQISRLVIIPDKIISKFKTNDVNVGQPHVETDLSADGDWGHIYIQRALRIFPVSEVEAPEYTLLSCTQIMTN